ncbi:hypothetical protein HAX54_027299 [Datura stramonium]|uniref:Uncharacterized protein n=1 Tax=Datura stramonium TaxID=4076 RepID=A0ABS8V502_DATST|nr:hypothetical protein [Datura stramonium]
MVCWCDAYYEDYGAVDNVLVDYIPYVITVATEMDGVDVGSGAQDRLAPSLQALHSYHTFVCQGLNIYYANIRHEPLGQPTYQTRSCSDVENLVATGVLSSIITPILNGNPNIKMATNIALSSPKELDLPLGSS